jgi:hypothetical protein
VNPRRVELAPRRRLGQRERERERRVSDADASYYGPIRDAKTLNNAIPQRMHAKNNSLSEVRPGPSPKVPVKTKLASTTKTDPKPDLMYARCHLAKGLIGVYTRRANSCQPLLAYKSLLPPHRPSPTH